MKEAVVTHCRVLHTFPGEVGSFVPRFHPFSQCPPHTSGVREGCRGSGGYWNAVGFWGGAPNTHTSVPHRLAKMFLDTWDMGV